MKPSVYLYQASEKHYELYLGEISTLDGLSILDESAPMSIINFGATDLKGDEWTSERDLPKFSTVGELTKFLWQRDFSIVDFEADIEGIGIISTHDDAECHYKFLHMEMCLLAIEKTTPKDFFDVLVENLMNNPGSYVTCSDEGKIVSYSSFDQYLAAKRA